MIVSQVLSNMFSKAQELGWITGFSAAKNGTLVNHLQFADDTIVFLDAKRDQVNYLRYILLCFKLMSGLKINFSKSSLFRIAIVDDLDMFASMLGYKVASWPTSYLGLPLGDKSRSKSKWDQIIEKCASRLAPWRGKFLSRGGKLTLIQSVLLSLPLY